MSLSSSTTTDPAHIALMRLALLEAAKCTPAQGAFSVGCLVVAPDASAARVLAAGHSRELPGNTHAEANALAKLAGGGAAGADVYTTLEPCSVRTSGLAPCADALVAARVRHVFIGAGEPDDYVTCEGAQCLLDAGIAVVWVRGLEAECLRAARRGVSTGGAPVCLRRDV